MVKFRKFINNTDNLSIMGFIEITLDKKRLVNKISKEEINVNILMI